ncbi:DUF1194 domain-containing protein [Falsiroseomonas sp.]|uniref:DUF1194 domain-containing protein n=1 Tax=Falsiroseomonas sp. TaxID=2870721 RepID=UPI003567DE0C
MVAAICGGAGGAIGVAYVEWAGAGYQRLVVPWTRIASLADAEAFAARLPDLCGARIPPSPQTSTPPSPAGSTSRAGCCRRCRGAPCGG